MALYLGNDKIKINLGGVAFIIATPSSFLEKALLSADNFLLVDSNGIYLTVKGSE